MFLYVPNPYPEWSLPSILLYIGQGSLPVVALAAALRVPAHPPLPTPPPSALVHRHLLRSLSTVCCSHARALNRVRHVQCVWYAPGLSAALPAQTSCMSLALVTPDPCLPNKSAMIHCQYNCVLSKPPSTARMTYHPTHVLPCVIFAAGGKRGASRGPAYLDAAPYALLSREQFTEVVQRLAVTKYHKISSPMAAWRLLIERHVLPVVETRSTKFDK